MLEINSDYVSFIKGKGITYFSYITHNANLENILNSGYIYSRNKCVSLGIFDTSGDISYDGYQENRTRNLKSAHDLDAHDYVPMFIYRDPPMLMRVMREHGKENIAVLEYDLSVLETASFFSDENCAGSTFELYTDSQQLGNLDWKTIKAKYPKWNELGFEDAKLAKSAEILFKEEVSTDLIRTISYHSSNKDVKEIGKKHDRIKLRLRNSKYWF